VAVFGLLFTYADNHCIHKAQTEYLTFSFYYEVYFIILIYVFGHTMSRTFYRDRGDRIVVPNSSSFARVTPLLPLSLVG
jgi:hypothetical protein